MIEKMVDLIWEVAKSNPKGFTVNLALEHFTAGFVIAYKETQNSFGKEGLKKALIHAIDHEGFIGGWLNKENELQFDSVFIETDLDTAIDQGRKEKQISIYYLNKNVEIIL
jgi:hypothetical protein